MKYKILNTVSKFVWSTIIFAGLMVWTGCGENTKNYIDQQEYQHLQTIVSKVHQSIDYGVGNTELLFADEIIGLGEGHCGHFSWLLSRELWKQGYKNEIVLIITYNKRDHTMVQVTTNDNHTILVDATTNLVYKHSVQEILSDPKLSQDVVQKGVHKSYSDVDFWSSVETLRFTPYIGISPLNNIKKIVDKQHDFHVSPNDQNALFDFNYGTYGATQGKGEKEVALDVKFTKKNRMSSVVVYPYDMQNYPAHLKIVCDGKTLTDAPAELKRSMIIYNFPNEDSCSNVQLGFSNFQGQKRLLIKDIYFYGK